MRVPGYARVCEGEGAVICVWQVAWEGGIDITC